MCVCLKFAYCINSEQILIFSWWQKKEEREKKIITMILNRSRVHRVIRCRDESALCYVDVKLRAVLWISIKTKLPNLTKNWRSRSAIKHVPARRVLVLKNNDSAHLLPRRDLAASSGVDRRRRWRPASYGRGGGTEKNAFSKEAGDVKPFGNARPESWWTGPKTATVSYRSTRCSTDRWRLGFRRVPVFERVKSVGYETS